MEGEPDKRAGPVLKTVGGDETPWDANSPPSANEVMGAPSPEKTPRDLQKLG